MVTAIDVQQSIIQTTAAEKIQQIQQQHADMQQRYNQLKLSEEDRLAREKVNQFHEADKAIIRNKEEKEDKEDKRRGKHSPKHIELFTDEDDEASEEGGHINIKV
jgi:beta-N-acetylglucosaminidase